MFQKELPRFITGGALILRMREMDHIMELMAVVVIINGLDTVVSTDNPVDAF